MVVIEGIGDEVLQFFGIIFIVLLLTIAWKSTKVRGANLYINLLLLWLHMRFYEELLRLLRILLVRRNVENNTEEEDNTLEQTSAMGEESASPNTVECIVNDHDSSTGSVIFSKQSSNNSNQLDPMNNINSPNSSQNQNSNVICIKLKFSNASVNTIHGDLNERLGDFKRRIFNTELAEDRTVLLIFNGKILNNDGDTLRACGLFSNCFVHCLIREPSSDRPETRRVETRPISSSETPRQDVQRDYADFGFAMMTILFMLSMLLIVSWYSRYHYRELFSLSATAGLMLLTGLFIAFVVSSYLPEREINQLLF